MIARGDTSRVAAVGTGEPDLSCALCRRRPSGARVRTVVLSRAPYCRADRGVLACARRPLSHQRCVARQFATDVTERRVSS